MRFEDELWVKLYKRDTATIMNLGWEARALQREILRKVDRAGILELGRAGMKALSNIARMPLEVVERALPELIAEEVVELRPDGILVMPKFIDAQECASSGAARSRSHREKVRDAARLAAWQNATTQQNVSSEEQNVTQEEQNVSQTKRGETARNGAERSATKRREEKRQDKDLPHDSLRSSSPPSGGQGRKRAEQGTRLAQDWVPNETSRRLCAELGMNLDYQLAQFKGYWVPLPGNRAKKLDWDQTFQTRLRDQAGRSGPRLIADRQPPPRPVLVRSVPAVEPPRVMPTQEELAYLQTIIEGKVM